MSVRAVLFDFMGTLARFVPEQAALLVAAAASQGVRLTEQDARRGFAAAGDWWVLQVEQLPLEERGPEERKELYRGFDVRVLQGGGVHLPEEQAFLIFRELLRQGQGSRLALFDDVEPALQQLRARGVSLGMISNMGRELPQVLKTLGLGGYMATVVSSGEVGVSKPHPRIFRAALERAGLAPQEVLFVGDQYENDVLGARKVGITPILVDRYDLFSDLADCTRVRSLEEVPDQVKTT
ncbi:MAG: HAD-IA family hydrolase [Chloroflexi bacterium]|nr:HAD-IA family hydrolase [Chloroflexota bacterium]